MTIRQSVKEQGEGRKYPPGAKPFLVIRNLLQPDGEFEGAGLKSSKN